MLAALMCTSVNAFVAPASVIRSRAASMRAQPTMSTLSDFSLDTLSGDAVSLSKYAGKPTVVVNVASL